MNNKKLILDWEARDYLKIIVDGDYDSKAKIKAKIILMRSKNIDIATIINETGLSKRTIINYTNAYIDSDNIKHFFFENNYNKSTLSKHRSLIINDFKKKPPLSYKEATVRIEKLTGIVRSVTQIRIFLNKNKIYTYRSRNKNLKYYQKRKLIKDSISVKETSH